MEKQRQTPWRVCYDGKEITIYFDKDCSAEYVRNALIDNDGYPENTKVYKIITTI